MEADRIDEPKDSGAIDMLAALPAVDAGFYENELVVLDASGKSEVLLREIEDRYNFISGSDVEYW
eukprot:2450651-Alexandrium_andersonii.AAC.1